MSPIPSWASDYLAQALPGNPVLNGRELSYNRVLANTRQGAVLVKRGLFGGIKHQAVEVAQDRVQFRCTGCGHNLQFYNLELPATVYCSICAAKYHVAAGGTVTDAADQTVQAERSGASDEHGACSCCIDGCCETGVCCEHEDCSACCEQTGCCAQGCDAASCCPDGTCQCCEHHEHGACCEQSGCCEGDCNPATCCPDETCECCVAHTHGGRGHGTHEIHGHEAGHDHGHEGHGHGSEESDAPAILSAFTHNGYTLYKREVETKTGSRPLYFFSKGEPKSGEKAALPAGHEVGVNERTGLPFLRRSSTIAKPVASLTGYKGDSHPVIDVEGIGPTWAHRLNECGVRTTDELGRTDAQALASRMGEAVETIRFWQSMAELMKVKGIGPQYAEALSRSGVLGIDALKAGKAADIATSTNAWLDAQKQTVIKTRLTAARVTGWQKAAKGMRRSKQEPHALA